MGSQESSLSLKRRHAIGRNIFFLPDFLPPFPCMTERRRSQLCPLSQTGFMALPSSVFPYSTTIERRRKFDPLTFLFFLTSVKIVVVRSCLIAIFSGEWLAGPLRPGFFICTLRLVRYGICQIFLQKKCRVFSCNICLRPSKWSSTKIITQHRNKLYFCRSISGFFRSAFVCSGTSSVADGRSRHGVRVRLPKI